MRRQHPPLRTRALHRAAAAREPDRRRSLKQQLFACGGAPPARAPATAPAGDCRSTGAIAALRSFELLPLVAIVCSPESTRHPWILPSASSRSLSGRNPVQVPDQLTAWIESDAP